MENIILVTEQDEAIGTMEKMEAHRKGALHRAFSIFIFNDNGQMLLQQRAASKYHGGGLWTNACCSHPREGEKVEAAAQRRLQEEMGFSTSLTPAFTFIYNEPAGNDLIEHEFDHVFIGNYSSTIVTNPAEVQDFCYMSMKEIEDALSSHPQKYTVWFKIAFPKMQAYLAKKKGENEKAAL